MTSKTPETLYDAALRYHKPVVEAMRKIGYGLMLDGDTFYELGYEIAPYDHITFTMKQAYSITTALEATKREARVDEHQKWVLPKVDEAHRFEQRGEDSGIQYFDNERLVRLVELSHPTHPKQEGGGDAG